MWLGHLAVLVVAVIAVVFAGRSLAREPIWPAKLLSALSIWVAVAAFFTALPLTGTIAVMTVWRRLD